MPEIIIVAGPNGAGKTTFSRQHLAALGAGYTFLNADELARSLSGNEMSQTERDLRAARLMLQRMDELSRARTSFIVETPLSAMTYLRKIDEWKGAGYRVTLIYLRLPSVENSIERVKRRVSLGGHNIPEPTIRRRFGLSLENLEKHYKAAADTWYVYDSLDGQYRLAETSQ